MAKEYFDNVCEDDIIEVLYADDKSFGGILIRDNEMVGLAGVVKNDFGKLEKIQRTDWQKTRYVSEEQKKEAEEKSKAKAKEAQWKARRKDQEDYEFKRNNNKWQEFIDKLNDEVEEPRQYENGIDWDDLQGYWRNSFGGKCKVKGNQCTFESGKSFTIKFDDNDYILGDWFLNHKSNTIQWFKKNGENTYWCSLPEKHFKITKNDEGEKSDEEDGYKENMLVEGNIVYAVESFEDMYGEKIQAGDKFTVNYVWNTRVEIINDKGAEFEIDREDFHRFTPKEDKKETYIHNKSIEQKLWFKKGENQFGSVELMTKSINEMVNDDPPIDSYGNTEHDISHYHNAHDGPAQYKTTTNYGFQEMFVSAGSIVTAFISAYFLHRCFRARRQENNN